MKALFLLCPVFLMLICCGAPDFHPLSLEWARYIAAHPGGHDPESEKGRAAQYSFGNLEDAGYRLYQQKRDAQAVKKYEQALRLYATGQLYYRYANSLSNLPGRLQDAAVAYRITRSLGSVKDGAVSYNAACAYSRLGNTKEAVVMLRKAAADGYGAFGYMQRDPDLRNVRALKQWPDVLRELKVMYDRAYIGLDAWAAIKRAALGGHTDKLRQLLRQLDTKTFSMHEGYILFDELVGQNLMEEALLIAGAQLPMVLKSRVEDPVRPVTVLLQKNMPSYAIRLLEMGYSPTNHHYYGRSPMNEAAFHGQISVLKYCFNKGYTVDTPGSTGGRTPLYAAISGKQYATVRFLLERGAEIDPVQFGSASAYSAAVSRGDKRIISLIRDHEAKVKGRSAKADVRTFFIKHYLGKELVNYQVGQFFVFHDKGNFRDHGLGEYSLNVIDENKWVRKHHSFPFEGGPFRFLDNRIELQNQFAYLGFARIFRIIPQGANALIINGVLYQVVPRGAVKTIPYKQDGQP